MELIKEKPNYVRFDDDVSFQILRTNPRLTTNTKVMYDGDNLYMDTYEAVPLLSTQKYKHKKILKNGMFTSDITNFLSGTSSSAYTVGQKLSNLIISDSFDDQFETMYWCGAEVINSSLYEQELGFVAPLYLRKKLPNYFVIFKIDGPSNTNLNIDDSDFIDGEYNFNEDILSNAKILKTFDLHEGTAIGDYIRRYVNQKNFKYDQSVYVNFGSKEIYYYGIDRSNSVLTTKVESIEDALLNNDNTILKSDDWITNGFERNNLIFPYIINFEFLFDDNDTNDYEFSRYFGLYCNDLDLFSNVRINDIKAGGEVRHNHQEIIDELKRKSGQYYYIKDKNNNIYRFDGEYVPENVKLSDLIGFENKGINIFANRISGYGHSTAHIRIDGDVHPGDCIDFYNNVYEEDFEDIPGLNRYHFCRIVASDELPAGTYKDDKFSCLGSKSDIARAISLCINEYDMSNITDSVKLIKSYSNGDEVAFRSINYGSKYDDILSIEITSSNITKLSDFIGGTDFDGCLFKINSSDRPIFEKSEGSENRYIKAYSDKHAEILSLSPYINDEMKFDSDYSILCTDTNGKYVNISTSEQIEIIDKYYSKVGVLCFFPVRDFDFDTMSSVYGNSSMMDKEIDNFNKNSDSGYLKYNRMVDHNNNKIYSEYDYFFENILPELSTINKTVPSINKWGYMDESKDSCENNYRLNTSKIFDTCNFSANTFIQKCDIQEYTHSMPYYLVSDDYDLDINEYQYIKHTSDMPDITIYGSDDYNPGDSDDYKSYSYFEIVNKWKEFFADTKVDNFEKIFIGGNNKRFNKKYSRFLLGSDKNNSSTLFRGVKFNILEYKYGKEIKSNKYNGYKFSFLYIPIQSKNNIVFSNKVYFIKNDSFKFIVGIIFVSTLEQFITNKKTFNKSYIYGGCNTNINIDEYADSFKSINISNVKIDDLFTYDINENNNVIFSTLQIKQSTLLQNLIEIAQNDNDIIIHTFSVNDGEDSDSDYDLDITKLIPDLKLSINKSGYVVAYSLNYDINKLNEYIYDPKNCVISIKILIPENCRKKYCENILNIFNTISINNIKKNINDELNVEFLSADGIDTGEYKIKIIDPESVTTYDIFTSLPVITNTTNKSVISSVDVVLKQNTSDMNLKIINRYSGYYNPIFKDIIFYEDYKFCNDDLKSPNISSDSDSDYEESFECDYEDLKFSNTLFDYDYEDIYGKFGVINNLWFHRVNENKSSTIINTLTPYYPLIGEYAIDYKDYNIFSSNWDAFYYTRQVDSLNKELCMNIAGMKNDICMFGSKYLNLPEIIEIEGLNGSCEWNDEFIKNPDAYDCEMMYKEVNGNSVNFYLFLKKRLLRYFRENKKMINEFSYNINPEYSFGLTSTIDDDINEYVIKNIMKLYKLEKVKVYIKSKKTNIYDSRIENDYVSNAYLPIYDLKKNGFIEHSNIILSKDNIDEFDRKVVYNLKSGYQEEFGFSFVFKKQ